MDGIRVWRVWTYITANEGFVKRILDYQSFMVTAIMASPFVRGVDVVIGTSPQFFTVCAAWAVSGLKRVPFVFELRDLWPESIKAVGAMQDSALIRGLERIEMFLYRRASRIVSVTHSFKRKLAKRGVDDGKVSVVTNGVDVSRFSPQKRDDALARQLGLTDKFVAGYIGTHGMAHGLETLLQAAALLRTRPGGDSFRILMLGDGARKAALVEQAREMGLDNMIFIDSVSKEEVVRYWSLLNVSIIHLRKTELFTSVIPSKLFECMGMGIPVLHGVEGESADIVRKEGVGMVFEPENVSLLVAGLEKMHSDRDAYEAYRLRCLNAAGRYDRTALALEMLKTIEDTVAAARV
jgi:glycosyltransferase involved in cell wall biosynthesis